MIPLVQLENPVVVQKEKQCREHCVRACDWDCNSRRKQYVQACCEHTCIRVDIGFATGVEEADLISIVIEECRRISRVD